MKHKHYDKIVAKAKNMDLVVFTKDCIAPNNKPWLAIESGHLPAFDEHCEYFLCLPQHKEVCLHWLNGGEVQNNITKHLRDDSWIYFTPFNSSSCEPWAYNCNFMREESNFRIKPRKEKRWIGVLTENGVTTDTCMSLKEAKHHPMVRDCLVSDWQFIEIEVEV